MSNELPTGTPAPVSDSQPSAPQQTATSSSSSSSSSAASASSPARFDANTNFVQGLLSQMEKNAGTTLGPLISKATPVLVALANAADTAFPYCVKAADAAKQAWAFIEPFGPEQYYPIIFGAFLLFFGGAYMMLVAAIEALRMTVWDKLRAAFTVLYDNYGKVRIAHKKDDELDENNDGIPDVQQRTSQENFTRRVYIFFRSADPDQVIDALVMLWSATLTVIGTVRMRMAQCLTFGVGLGETLYGPLQPSIEPVVNNALPADLKHWAKRGTRQLFNIGGVMVAYVFQRVITAFHSSTRGATLVVAGLLRIAEKRGMQLPFKEGERNTVIMVWVLAALGFYFQWTNGFTVSFPLNLLLLPATLLENGISLAIAFGLGM